MNDAFDNTRPKSEKTSPCGSCHLTFMQGQWSIHKQHKEERTIPKVIFWR